MAEITYLIGAGASYQALPIVSEMAKKIGETIVWLELSYTRHHIPNGFSTIEAQKFQTVLLDLKWLQEICDTSKNFSVDTYARKLHLSGRKVEYIRLKNILSFYFTLEQKRCPPDTRYDNFWASILKHKYSFPNNIKILSWNYDFQFELTYQDFIQVQSLKSARETLNMIGLETSNREYNPANLFGIFKINGSATFYDQKNRWMTYLIDNVNDTDIKEFIIELVDTYRYLCNVDNNCKNHLSFAWEHASDEILYTHLQEVLKNTEILVVIGYSFPFFNREVDKFLLKDCMSQLRKVYFQAPDAEDVRERFLAINDKIHPENLLLRKDIKQFTLPNEL